MRPGNPARRLPGFFLALSICFPSPQRDRPSTLSPRHRPHNACTSALTSVCCFPGLPAVHNILPNNSIMLMESLALLRDLFLYDVWANRQMIACIASGDPLRLMAHILASERLWWARIQGQAEGLTPWPDLSLEECRELAETMSTIWSNYLGTASEGTLPKKVSYTNSQGTQFHTGIGDILMHVANHSTYHRAQIARALRQEGIAPPRTDYIAYVREGRGG